MKKYFIAIYAFIFGIVLVSCSNNCCKNEIELMGAGDRIHDSYTFANVGVSIEREDESSYLISGSVEKFEDEKVKKEFSIDEDVTHLVAIKLSANGAEVEKDKVKITVDGVRNYDAEHLNGSDYTFIILEAKVGSSISIKVAWNGEDEKDYNIKFDDNLLLK